MKRAVLNKADNLSASSKSAPAIVEEKDKGKKGRVRIFAEYGATGLKNWSGRLDEEWLQQLSSQEKRIKIYREMRDNDPVIGAILYAIDLLIRQATWRVSPAGPQNEYQEAADFVQQCLDDMSQSWLDVVSEVLSFLVYGWSYHEIVYKQRLGIQTEKDGRASSKFNDGRVGWRKLPIRSQDTLEDWRLDDQGGIQGMTQIPPPTYRPRFVPIEKALLFRTAIHKGSPEGRSLLRNVFRPWMMKKRIEEIEGIGIERDLAGLPVIYAPSKIMLSGATSDEQAVFTQLKKIVQNVRRDEQEGLIMPGDRNEQGHLLYEMQLLSTGGSRQFNTNEVINRIDQRIASSVLADFILLGQQKVGSFALASSKTELFSVGLGTYMAGIAEVMNRYAIPRLFEINGLKTDKLPTLEHGDVEMPNLAELGNFITQLAGAGVPLFPDEDLEAHLREVARLPKRKESSAAIPGMPPGMVAGSPTTIPSLAPLFSGSKLEQDDLDQEGEPGAES